MNLWSIDTSAMSRREVWSLFLLLPKSEQSEYWRRWSVINEARLKPRPLGRMMLEDHAGEFWGRVNVIHDDTSCWEWKMPGAAYPSFKLPNGRTLIASRVAYALARGYCPDLYICHTCDNPRCVRPEHLVAASAADNLTDMVAKNRQPQSWLHFRSTPIEEIQPTLHPLTPST